MPEESSNRSNVSSKGKKKTPMRLLDEDRNPCLMEADISRRCLEDNYYVRDKCSLEYDNYNQCKKFWGKLSKERRTAGIKPLIPTKEEREKILELKKKGQLVYSAS